jgi:hypothetical protein
MLVRAERNLESFHGRQGAVRGVDVDENFFFKIFFSVQTIFKQKKTF